jgi:hypothetical protein
MSGNDGISWTRFHRNDGIEGMDSGFRRNGLIFHFPPHPCDYAQGRLCPLPPSYAEAAEGKQGERRYIKTPLIPLYERGRLERVDANTSKVYMFKITGFRFATEWYIDCFSF